MLINKLIILGKAYMTPDTLERVWSQEEEKCKELKNKYLELMKKHGVYIIIIII